MNNLYMKNKRKLANGYYAAVIYSDKNRKANVEVIGNEDDFIPQGTYWCRHEEAANTLGVEMEELEDFVESNFAA